MPVPKKPKQPKKKEAEKKPPKKKDEHIWGPGKKPFRPGKRRGTFWR